MTTTSYPLRKPLEVIRLYAGHDNTIAGLFASRLHADANRPLIFSAGTWWTWGQIAERAARLARLLVVRGVHRGDRVAVMGLNSDKHVLLLLALSRIGAIMVPINAAFGKGETTYILGDCKPTMLACDVEVLDVVREASRDSGVAPWLVSLGQAIDDVPSLESLLKADQNAELASAGAPDDTCLIVYTSGTTGFPKGVMHSQRTFLTVGEASVQRVYLQPDDRVLIVLPMFHINALFYSVAGTLTAGCAMVVTPKFSASRFWDFVVETGATEVNIIEAIGTILMNRPRSEFRPGHSLRAVYGVRQAAAPTFRDEFGIPDLITGYGMTEIPGALCSPFEGPQKPGSMGIVGAHPDPHRHRWTEARVVDEEGRQVGADVIGELSVKTPVIMQGYYGKPEQTAQAFRDGWFMTGDLVRRDADGYFYFVSRKGDIIRRRGENISGAEIDRIVAAHPQVQEVAAVPIASELGEDEILVAVRPKPGAALNAEEITQWCAERLAPAKVPRYVLFVTELPHTATHKIAKQVLRSDPTLKARAIDTSMSKTRETSSRS